jgi:indolepyruvate ferredoxin oxidoreductase
LVPGNTQELLDYSVIGFELSRYSGCWIGLKVVTSVADSVGSVNVELDRLVLTQPQLDIDGARWTNVQRTEVSASLLIDRERDLLERRLVAAGAFAAANGLNRIDGARDEARVGIVAAGKTFYDVRRALDMTDDQLREAGIRLLKLGMIYPLEPGIVREFAEGLDAILVVEEKREFVELAVRSVLYDAPNRPKIMGKRDASGSLLIPAHGELTADRLRPLLRASLQIGVAETPIITPAVTTRATMPSGATAALPLVQRTSAYCSGCPHNRSTVLPAGAVMGGGVGCHGMSYFDPRLATNEKLAAVPMGSEGVPWVGMARFANATHVFQNLGDGTFAHSGLLALRACVAAGTSITFKLLYNGFVAMTGGLEVSGGMSGAAITRELQAEGVTRTVVVAVDPTRYRRVRDLASGVKVYPRGDIEKVQEELQRQQGVSVLIYDSVCAAEARRLRRVGKLPVRERRVLINELVCEGCGDCGVKSNCLSVQPVDTSLGRKTQIHQTSCNTDYSCLDGDCPAFVTFKVKKRPKPRRASPGLPPLAEVREPSNKVVLGNRPYSAYLIGIGGTGVVTVNQILATAALLDGLHTVGLDQTGMSQKAGAVVSHLQFSRSPISDRSAAVTDRSADLYLGFDLLSAASGTHLARIEPQRTIAVLSASLTPTSAVVANVDARMPDTDDLLDRIREVAGAGQVVAYDAASTAREMFGSEVTANVLLLGVAYQRGALPLNAASIEEAIRLNGVSVEENLAAFSAGRGLVDGLKRSAPSAEDAPRLGAVDVDPSPAARGAATTIWQADSLPEEIALWTAELIDFQNRRVAMDYAERVRSVAAQTDDENLIREFGRHLFRLTAYKDEYEVARLHLKLPLTEMGDDGSIVSVRYMLHPPLLRAMGLRHKLAFGSWVRPAFRVLRGMRRLRGRWFDPFGLSHVRRVERALPGEYAAAVLAALSVGDAQGCAAVATAELVRGYEQIKLDNVERFREALRSPASDAA